MTGNAQVSAHHIDEGGIALGGPDGGHVTDEPEDEPRDPGPQSKSKGGRQRAVDDRNRSRLTAYQDRLGERTVNGHDKTCDRVIHQITTPPPKEKNDRKKLEAANAIDRPNTIWINLRKPPDVSPKASERPVTMMMMTAMILATGPSTDCRIWLSGCSQGMLEPAANAGMMVK